MKYFRCTASTLSMFWLILTSFAHSRLVLPFSNCTWSILSFTRKGEEEKKKKPRKTPRHFTVFTGRTVSAPTLQSTCRCCRSPKMRLTRFFERNPEHPRHSLLPMHQGRGSHTSFQLPQFMNYLLHPHSQLFKVQKTPCIKSQLCSLYSCTCLPYSRRLTLSSTVFNFRLLEQAPPRVP
ncbi:hypothetical protein FVE85_3981 [Porphyridium purpureum]|uniref:Secreted protein n=1 Tax=Porphyridium purpureum TaxID=35688 RepID=A0A5J4YRS4_PORPP|nr:hypothetical protein FVE85_3981 [Porphyridium purpureum]|eukprot:POR1583..scf229_5